jgi:hypothetical protein
VEADEFERRIDQRTDATWPFVERRAHLRSRPRLRLSPIGTDEHVAAATARFVAGRAGAGDLRTSVAAYVRRLRLDGEPPQRMLVRVKGLVGGACPLDMDPGDRRAVVDDVVRWSIHAYYRPG